MGLNIGRQVWLCCDVKPGPFDNERFVRVPSSLGEWIGFIPTSYLEEPIVEGKTKVTAKVLEIREDRSALQIPGESLSQTVFMEMVSKLEPNDAL